MFERMLFTILGGILTSWVPLLIWWKNQERWKTEKRVELLRIKQDRLDKIYKDVLDKYIENMMDGVYIPPILYETPKSFLSLVSV
jgi:hypothetical protein